MLLLSSGAETSGDQLHVHAVFDSTNAKALREYHTSIGLVNPTLRWEDVVNDLGDTSTRLALR